MTIDRDHLRGNLRALVDGTTALRHDGRFDEPNLDGSAGDYISFHSWEWPQGVALYGLVRLWMQSGDPALQRLIEDWYAARIAEGLPALNINTTAPMLALSLLWRETRDPRWEPVLRDWADRVVAEAPRTVEGAFQHDVSDRLNHHELWDDTLFMAALFLAVYGSAARRDDLVDEAIGQFLVHARYLADRSTGLWFHGWTFEGRHNFAQARWARGNAWITAAVLDLLEFSEVPRAVERHLLGILNAQVEALLRCQAASGAWHTLLDDPSSYQEISATAGFGYGLLKGARLGVGDERWRSAGMKALGAVLVNIENGTVQNVSYGTRMGHDLEFYRNIPIQPTGYGQALAILCLGEGLHHATPAGPAKELS